jgi:hypothetical protein
VQTDIPLVDDPYRAVHEIRRDGVTPKNIRMHAERSTRTRHIACNVTGMKRTLSAAHRLDRPQVRPTTQGFNAHLEFFDRDGDQKISVRETQLGLERIGLGHLVAWPATALIHLGVAGLGVVRGNWQNPLQLSMPSVGVLRHPDTALVDERAAFDPARLDGVFAKHGRRCGGEALTLAEIAAMTTERLRTKTRGLTELLLLPGGMAGTFVEWGALFWLAGELRDGRRVLTKRAALRFYTDPQFFHDVASRLERLRAERARSTMGSFRNLVQRWFL